MLPFESCRFSLSLFLLPALISVAPAQDRYRIDLQNRKVTPKPLKSPTGAIQELLKSTPKVRRVFIQFYQKLSADARRQLSRQGIQLQSPLTRTTFVAKVTGNDYSSDKAKKTIDKLVRWVGPIQPADKLSNSLFRKKPPGWAVDRKTGEIKLVLRFFPDVKEQVILGILQTLKLKGERYGANNSWTIVADQKKIQSLTKLDQVQFIQPGPAPALPLNNGGRLLTRTDQAQQPDFTAPRPTWQGVSGKNVHVAICDPVGIDELHDDFKRINNGGAATTPRFYHSRSGGDWHGTHVASIAAGNGFNSSACSHPAFSLRGHAPKALLGDFNTFGGKVVSFAHAINTKYTDVTNHSYVQSETVYDDTAASLDTITRGDATSHGVVIPPRPQVWAAGNNGLSPEFGDEEGYYSIFASAKNPICVGSVDTRDGRLSKFSSLGPTFDGRVKPDLVAPGCRDSISGDGILAAYVDSQDYTKRSGTSMAAPVVTGIIALMLHQHDKTSGSSPDLLPSTFKAILIHSARDCVKAAPHPSREFNNPDTGEPVIYHAGPDYATGYGLVDAEGACKLVAAPTQWTQATVSETDEVQKWTVKVASGEQELKVVLAWDDLPGDAMTAETSPKLVNDLDLLLIDPSGTEYKPWILDPLPLTSAPGSGAPDPIQTSDLKPAYRGIDRRNNVEMVSINLPVQGTWTVSVKADNLLSDEQRFSLVASGELAKANLMDTTKQGLGKKCGKETQIQLTNRALNVGPGIAPALQKLLAEEKRSVRGLIVLTTMPSRVDRAKLSRIGVHLDTYLGGTVYQATFSSGHRGLSTSPLVYWAGALEPSDKIEPQLWKTLSQPEGSEKGEKLKIQIAFIEKTSAKQAREVLGSLARVIRQIDPSGIWLVETNRANVEKLAAKHRVQRIESASHYFQHR